MTDVAALFVDPKGIYPELLGAERCWDEERDARLYPGLHPVVAHPPCNRWVNMAAVNWKRYGRQKPAWYPGGDDGGCFAAALAAVRRWGGVLEHPAASHAWAAHSLQIPRWGGWEGPGAFSAREWVCEVWQSTYGHRACGGKPTWLLYCGKRPPFELNWSRTRGTLRMSGFDKRPGQREMGKRERSATPRAFAEELIRLAVWSRG